MAIDPDGFGDESIYQSSRWQPSHVVYRMGRAIAIQPYLVICFNLLLIFVFGGHFLANYMLVNDLAQLWSPYGSRALESFEGIINVVQKQNSPLVSTILVESSVEGANVLTVEVFDTLFQLDFEIRNYSFQCLSSSCHKTLERHKEERTYFITFEDLCMQKDKKECYRMNPLRFWNNYSDFIEKVDNNQTKLLEQLSSTTFWNGEEVYHNRLFGAQSLVRDPLGGNILFSESILFTYYLTKEWGILPGTIWSDAVLEMCGLKGAANEGSFGEALANPFKGNEVTQEQPFDSIKITPTKFNSYDKETSRVIYDNARFVLLEYLLMIVFVCMALSISQYMHLNEVNRAENKPPQSPWRFWEYSRFIQGVGGVLSVFLSTLVGYGCCSWIGVVTSDKSDYWYMSEVQTSLPFNALEMVLPFILVAIGVDDMFILISNFHETNRNWPHADRVASCLLNALPSIGFTTTTDIAAFAFGAVSASTPAIKVFCVYAFISIFFDFVFQITFFLAIMSLDEQWKCERKQKLPLMPSARKPITLSQFSRKDRSESTDRLNEIYDDDSEESEEDDCYYDDKDTHRDLQTQRLKTTSPSSSPTILEQDLPKREFRAGGGGGETSQDGDFSPPNASRTLHIPRSFLEIKRPAPSRNNLAAEDDDDESVEEAANKFNDGHFEEQKLEVVDGNPNMFNKEHKVETEKVKRTPNKGFVSWYTYVRVITLCPIAFIIVIATLLGSLVAGYWGLENMTIDFSTSMLVPEGGYLHYYSEQTAKYGLGDEFFFDYDIFFPFDQKQALQDEENPDFWGINLPEEGSVEEKKVLKSGAQVNAPVVQRAMLKFSEEHFALKYNAGPHVDWLSLFLDWVAINGTYAEYLTEGGYFDGAVNETTKSAFTGAVSAFLFDEEFNYLQPAIILKGSKSNKIIGTTVSLVMEGATTLRKRIVAMNLGFDHCEESALNVYQYHASFAFMSQFPSMKEDMIRNFAVCLLGVILISYLFLGNKMSILILVVSLTCIDALILAIMTFSGLALNSVSTIALLMIVGLSVDYVAHIIHTYISNSEPDPRVRLEQTFQHMGGSVFLGGATTLVGVLPLSITKAYTFYVFYVMFLGIISTSIFFGFVVVPVLLVYLVPSPVTSLANQQAHSIQNKYLGDDDNEEGDGYEEHGDNIKKYSNSYKKRQMKLRHMKNQHLMKKLPLPARPVTIVPVSIEMSHHRSKSSSSSLDRPSKEPSSDKEVGQKVKEEDWNPFMPSKHELPKSPIDIQVFDI